MDDLRFEFRLVKDILLFFLTSRLGLEHKQPSVRWVPGFFLTSRLALEHKQPSVRWAPVFFVGLEVDHAPPYIADAKNYWIYTSTPRECLSGVDRNKFIFFNGSSNMQD
jgi:hypothetical protein